MQITFLTQIDWLIRLILAGICGYAIGYERNSRYKNAGTRTHLIVALSAALMIIVSKYGFMDIISTHGINLDPSRIAAQIVSGIGFRSRTDLCSQSIRSRLNHRCWHLGNFWYWYGYWFWIIFYRYWSYFTHFTFSNYFTSKLSVDKNSNKQSSYCSIRRY